ncbi:hypothetical protein ABPG75_000050 [Micractinium tetrahymenae]
MRTALGAALLLLLAAAVGVGAADLRAVYLERNGKDMRIEIITGQWLGRSGMAEELAIAAGQPIQWRNSLTTLEDTNYTLPVDLTVRFGTAEGKQARLVFQATQTGTVTLDVPRYTADPSCASGTDCVTCKGVRYRASTAAQQLTYGAFGQPPGVTSIGLRASLWSAAGLVANLTWPDAPFLKNSLATSSNPSVGAWTAYLQKVQGDTGQLALDALENYTFFTSDALPEGFLLASGADFQTQLDVLKQGWPNSNDCPLSAAGLPLLTIPYAVSTFTNFQYFDGRPLRNCSYLRSSQQGSSLVQEITCTFDIDLALVVRVADALNYLPTLNSLPPPPSLPAPPQRAPPPPLVPAPPGQARPPPPSPRTGTPPSMPPPPVEGAAGTSTASGPTLAFFANLSPPVLAAAWKDLFTSQLSNALDVDADVRILDIGQLSAAGVRVDTAIVFKSAADTGAAFALQSYLPGSTASIFDTELQPVAIDSARVAVYGVGDCFLTNTDCGAHGTLYPTLPSGCICKCDAGWQNSPPGAHSYYCSTFTNTTLPPPPPLKSPPNSPYAAPHTYPPPASKEYTSVPWWQTVGVGGWIGIACGILGAGGLGAVVASTTLAYACRMLLDDRATANVEKTRRTDGAAGPAWYTF